MRRRRQLTQQFSAEALARALEAHYGMPIAPFEPWRAGGVAPGPLPEPVWQLAADTAGGGPYIDARLLARCDVATAAEPLRRWAPIGALGFVQLVNNPGAARTPAVYLGEDGVRFGRDILRAGLRGRVLDVGSGTGLATLCASAHADEVLGVEIDEAAADSAVSATRLAQRSSSCSFICADFRAMAEPRRRWDCVITNLPGVPVPRRVRYGAAGDGGPDGLDLTRALLGQLQEWWHPDAGDRHPCLVMRLQSHGDTHRPHVLDELCRLAQRHRLRVTVTIDSRMDVDLRSAMTATYLSKCNAAELDSAQALRRASQHAESIGMRAYYSLAVVARRGEPTVEVDDQADQLLLDRHLTLCAPRSRDPAAAVAARAAPVSSRLPMGFWELGTAEDLVEAMRNAHPLYRLVAAGATGREACADLWSKEPSPYRMAVLESAANHVMNIMVAAGLLQRGASRVSVGGLACREGGTPS